MVGIDICTSEVPPSLANIHFRNFTNKVFDIFLVVRFLCLNMPPCIKKNNQRQSKIIKSKRVRVKNALPHIRGHYHNYTHAKIDWLTLFNLLENSQHNKKEIIHTYNAGMKYDAAIKRYRRWVKDGKQQQQATGAVQDNRGGHNAAMTVQEEQLCADYIKANYLEKHKPINQQDVRTLILAFYKQLHPHILRDTFDLKVGYSFVTRFMEKHQLVNSNGTTLSLAYFFFLSSYCFSLFFFTYIYSLFCFFLFLFLF
jgi:hypothetical protein